MVRKITFTESRGEVPAPMACSACAKESLDSMSSSGPASEIYVFAAVWRMDKPIPIRIYEITKPGKESRDELGQKENAATVNTPKPVISVALKPARVKIG